MNKKILLLCSLSTMVLASAHIECAEKKLLAGFHTDQGTKSYQEDRWHIGENLFFVADGHGGSQAATEVTDRFPNALTECLKTSATKKEAFESAVKKTDVALSDYEDSIFKHAGTTFAAAYVDEYGIHMAWVGDSRVICGSKNKITAFTQDHTLKSPSERERIIAARGTIYRDVRIADGYKGPWRINGSVPTRKIGGFDCRGVLSQWPREIKQTPGMRLERLQCAVDGSESVIASPLGFDIIRKPEQITSDPDYITIERGEDDHFLIVATDGLWDVMNNEYAMKFVEELAEKSEGVHGIAVALVNDALARGSDDNITAIVVDLRR